MDKKVLNEAQFRKLVLSEAKKIIAEGNAGANSEEVSKPTAKRKVTFERVESLIKEIEGMPKSILSISFEGESSTAEVKTEGLEEKWIPNKDRDLNPIEHNKKKNVMHVNENEKEKWSRMLNYKIPSDKER